ncbi:MAG: hypothetical protein P8J02_06790 [Yoonia sp.]|nr:hypothetical protein [Yoonia sp.]
MPAIKVGTCCYCGTRAALVLAGDTYHELSCASCGAPLRKLKMLPKAAEPVTAPTATPTSPAPLKPVKKRVVKQRNKPKKRNKISYLGRKIFDELWDVVEDVFD